MCKNVFQFMTVLAIVTSLLSGSTVWAIEIPPGMFKDLNDEIVGDAIIINGKQLFIDDYIIEDLNGAEKILNQPVKHQSNPLLICDQSWEQSGPDYGTVIYDDQEGIFKMWYQFRLTTGGSSGALLCYATSQDGITWGKPIVNQQDGTNIVFQPAVQGFQCAGILKDLAETDPARRYKMLFSANPDGTDQTWSTHAAYSPDGIDWTAEVENPLIPFSDSQVCPFWDAQRRRYVAVLRYGPPNRRLVSRIESTDFVHWSPKATILAQTDFDEPLAAQFYQMAPICYEGVYLGLVCVYHNETLQPLATDPPWTDRKNVYLAFSRNGATWTAVGKNGAIPYDELVTNDDWQQLALDSVFLPYGEPGSDWDWGAVASYYTPVPLVVGDQIWIYYMGQDDRHWWLYSADPHRPNTGVGLATLRLDGFVSIDAEAEGTMTTKPLVFLGDTLEVNADVSPGGSIKVEALGAYGQVIEGFSKDDCTAITTDSVRHVVQWNGTSDCYVIQAMPIKLRFYLENAKLYSFTPQITHIHYLQSYD